MAAQKTDWGEIQWLDDEARVLKDRRLQVGVVRVLVGGHQYRHIHYDEQVLYCISGRAVSIANGERAVMEPGDYYHYSAGIEHEVWCISDEPFVHLLISSPMPIGSDSLFHSKKRRQADPQLLYTAVEAIRSQFLETLNYSYVIFDCLGNPVIQSPRFPRYCVENCRPGENEGMCRCMRQLEPAVWKTQTTFLCPYGMEILHNPICYGDTFLGYIQGGYFRYSGKGAFQETIAAYDVPESVVIGVGALLRRIVKAIRNYCEFEQFRRELEEKELRIASESETKKILMQDLRKSRYEVTDLKINNHFLFNTLNQMASIAVEAGQMELYGSIVNLSKMFHYTLRVQQQMVPLAKELEYVDAYLSLQKLRFQEQLKIRKEIDSRLLEYEVPFNFLQPIVENAFIHGFPEEAEKAIALKAEQKEGKIRIRIVNSGKKLTDAECLAINRGIRANSSHGLSMIYQKIQAATENRSGLEVMRTAGGETCFCIELYTARVPAADKDGEEDKR